jgi:hypothetical protein
MEDLLPNDGQSFNPTNLPEDREQENLEELSKAAQAYPILDELIEATEEKLKDADSMTSLGIDSSTPAVQVQIIMEGNKKYQALLISHVEWLRGLKEVFESR